MSQLVDAATNKENSLKKGANKASRVPESYLSSAIDFLVAIAASLLVGSDGNATSKGDLIDVFNAPESIEIINKFACLTDFSAIFIESFNNNNVYSITISSSPSYKVISSVAIVKYKDGPIDLDKSIASQVQVTSTISRFEDGDSGAGMTNEKSTFSSLQQYTRHVLAPIIKASRQYAVSAPGPDIGTSVESQNIQLLQRRVRELDIAFDQCQREGLVPSVSLQVLPVIEAAAKKTNAASLKSCLDKYSVQNADELLSDLSLSETLGSTQEQKDDFNNEISRSAKQWPLEITRQTRLVESPFPSTIESEIEFWKDLERKLLETREQLDNPSVLLTKLVIRKLNRVSDQLIREAETDLERVIEQVQVSVAFLRDFPIEEIMMANTLHPKLSKTVSSCLQHFAKLKHSKYDFNRAVRLVEVLGKVVSVRVVALLKEKGPMECSFDDFLQLKRGADEVFLTWDTQYAMQRSTLKDIAKKRHEKLRPLQFDIEPLQQRLSSIFEFRDQHEKLLNVFSSVLSSQDMSILSELNDAYQLILHSGNDVIDITPSGAMAWSSSRQLYEKRLEMIEQRITRLLDSQLSAAKSADEMFAVFSTYNPLFFRLAIRNAVNSYRTVLLKNVREDVKRLQEKFRLRYDESVERTSADLRDIPPLSGRIIWARQIEHQLSALMGRMCDVLGEGWEDHAEGKQLKEVCDELRSYLDTDKLYGDWLSDQLRADSQRYNRLKDFLLLVEDDSKTGRPVLRVNFDDKQIVVFKEVRYLEWLLPTMSTAHKVIPSTIRAQSKEAFSRYPTAMALQAAIAGFSQAKRGISSFNSQLLAAHVLAVNDLIKEAFGGSKKSRRWVKWDSADLAEWISALSNKVSSLQERVVGVNDRLDRIDALLKALGECPYSRPSFDELMNKIQIIIDDMQVRGFSNITVWIAGLDARVQRVLRDRATRACADWCDAFAADSDLVKTPGSSSGAASLASDNPVVLDQTVHEVLLSNQLLYLSPSLEQARSEWIGLFHQHLHVICSLPRVVGSRFHVFSSADGGLRDHSNILGELPSDVVCRAFGAIEAKLAQANTYVDRWLNYQALWDASVVAIADRVGASLPAWRDLLLGVRATRETIDTTEEEKAFGPIVINHRQVQNKINVKYDTWQKELQIRFGIILLDAIKRTHAQLTSAKASLESVYFEGPTRDVISGVECVLDMKKQHAAMKEVVVDLEASEKLLQRQRYQFPGDWLPASNASSAFGDFCNILERRCAAMDALLPSLQAKIREEDKQLALRTEEALAHWATHRPLDGSRSPTDVLGDLSMIQAQIMRLTEDTARTRGAKDALGIDYLTDDRLSVAAEEARCFYEAWQAVLPMHERLQALRALPLRDANAGSTRVRKQLDEVTEALRGLPAKIRSYSAVEYMQETIAKIQTFQPVLRDIGTEALKDRHWKGVMRALGITGGASTATLDAFWSSDPLSSRKAIADIIATAQGELALEQFLRDLKEHWQSCELSLVSRDGVKLIAAWDVLFTALEDNLNSLASLKQSPYFKNVQEIQEEAGSWEGRLTALRAIFDSWVEVQRKWVYLRGIFRNPDIKAQLPSQYSKFKPIDSDIGSLAKRVSQKPAVLELLHIENLARQLERHDASMTLIQKALGEYLERQRQIFPRFYFVNNEDLVEIIGNSGEPAKILGHLSKMFAAIVSLKLEASTEGSGVPLRGVAMHSREGEEVPFSAPLDITAAAKEWLIDLCVSMRATLASLLQEACGGALVASYTPEGPMLTSLELLDSLPAQVVVLASQVGWTGSIEQLLDRRSSGGAEGSSLTSMLEGKLAGLSSYVLRSLSPALRKKCEQLLTEVVHQRDVTRVVVCSDTIRSPSDFDWLYHLRFYWSPREADLSRRLVIRMSNASFYYGFEYQGIGERLVQTPLTDRCYLTLTQALHTGFGGNPFGPAGTGKTESVKMLGSQMGRFVLVFNCDSSFDYAAMGRIFAGLCQVGAWGCFDEFNRLEERILSAVSQQVLTIQRGLLAQADTVQLLGSSCKLHKDVGIFVTLNPGYAGRSNLPDNLKQLFRAVAMTAPDKKMIAQVMLFSQGVVNAEELAGKVVLLFTFCEEQLSQQPHYDFGLRALKSVLVGAGELKRAALAAVDGADTPEVHDKSQMAAIETDVLIRSTCDSVLPKLVEGDAALFTSLLRAVFPNSDPPVNANAALLAAIRTVCAEEALECSDNWVSKILQLKKVMDLRHGVMLVGGSGAGKSTAWRTLLRALSLAEGVKGDFFVIDPKSVSKDKLYGSLDPVTLEWTDGVFTKILRRVCGAEGRTGRRSWIVFDGDVDPDWAENLNSVLDDNRVLTLPSGDRLKIPETVRIVMEVDSLAYATMATVSRCGMVWFPITTVALDLRLRQQLRLLGREDVLQRFSSGDFSYGASAVSDMQRRTQAAFAQAMVPHFAAEPSIVGVALAFALGRPHIMPPSTDGLLTSLLCLLRQGLVTAVEYNEANSDFPLSSDALAVFAVRWLLYSVMWAFGGSMAGTHRCALAELIEAHTTLDLPSAGGRLTDYFVSLGAKDGSAAAVWQEWSRRVPKSEIEPHKATSTDVVVPTVETVRNAEIIRAWLGSHKPLVLCGPPGSGKTMSLTAVLDGGDDYILALLNFSSGTSPELILKTLAQYCELSDGPEGLVMQPNSQTYRQSQWLVIFCDEVNLPDIDKYGTQRVVMFMRQLVEQGGYWGPDCKWVTIRRVQFVGACNPPSDAGRKSLSARFMRHAPLLLVDYPEQSSLKQIYRCFNAALLRLHGNLKGSVDALNDAMVDFYSRNRLRFTPDAAPQYVYSPRELSRWVRAMHEAMAAQDGMSLEGLVRLWAHEGLRLFHDRLIQPADQMWCEQQLAEVAQLHFPAVADLDRCLQKPLLYSSWLRRSYEPVGREELRSFVAARLRVFYEEELDIPLVLFDDVLEHVLRIDNVLRHPMGHLLLVGESGVGKTVLTRFVSWMNGLAVYQIKASSRYTLDQFDDDLRALLRRVGVDGEKVCFVFDESNVLSASFLERMNSLLASGEIPGLFDGDDRASLLAALREALAREGLAADSEDELWRRFTRSVQAGLHVVFTMNPASADFSAKGGSQQGDRSATSPALYNRCVVDWFGTWSNRALVQVAAEFTCSIDAGYTAYTPPIVGGATGEVLAAVVDTTGAQMAGLHEAITAALVYIHNSVRDTTLKMNAASSGRSHHISPRDFLDLIRKFVAVEAEKRQSLEEQQTHVQMGLTKLRETQDQVAILRQEMVDKAQVLRVKDTEANSKLTQMVDKQKQAEQRKEQVEQLTLQLNSQEEEIRLRRGSVEHELGEAEPALVAAKQCVQNIRKQQLDEVRALARPPNAIRLTMEMVAIMIGEKNLEWTELRKVIRRDDFIATIVNFDPTTLGAKQVAEVQRNYLESTEQDLTYERVDTASKACGPLYEWASSQIKYATILKRVKPLRDEVAALQEKAQELAREQREAVAQLAELEEAIKRYKAEYAAAIRDTETIRSEMDFVTNKVSRAEALLLSLESERERWQASSESFDRQMSTLIGDSLLAGAFLAYAGIFDQRPRRRLQEVWAGALEALGIPHRIGRNAGEDETAMYLCRPSDLLLWRGHGLPSDELAVQNAILLDRFNRYPLVIDPSGQAMAFILNKYAEQKMLQTSFLDVSFLKTLASAIRFGNALLVHDVESVDPILNPLLNRELQRAGGRTLIRLGNEDIDFSPKFLLILTTRDPLARFTPDLCSRVTMVNFSTTPASLESQVLSAILRAERPDVDSKRSEILRLQSEQAARLRDLEDSLLTKMSAVQGAILDDDTVMNSLETIRTEASQLTAEVLATAAVMAEVHRVSLIYEPLAAAMAATFFSLELLAEVSPLYQFSLYFFLEVVSAVLHNAAEGLAAKGAPVDVKAATERLAVLTGGFYSELSRRVMRSLRFNDKVLLMLRLALIATSGDKAKAATDAETNCLLQSFSEALVLSSPDLSAATLTKYKRAVAGAELDDPAALRLLRLCALPATSSLLPSMTTDAAGWAAFLASAEPELCVPPWGGSEAAERSAFLRALVVAALRPERAVNALDAYIQSVFGPSFNWRTLCELDLRALVDRDMASAGPGRPVLVCSEGGQDASSKVDGLATALGRPLLQCAMGSAEGFVEADRHVAQGCRSGCWVLLRNVHLCPEWLALLEKKLPALTTGAHSGFRLFLACEISTALPASLLRNCEVVVAEASTGVKANLVRFFSQIPAARTEKQPAERLRLYTLLAWLNAVIQERLRYAPLGWTKRYDFSESDLLCSLDAVDEWLQEACGGPGKPLVAHVAPEDIPWRALRTLLSQTLYGGRVDQPADQAALDSFIASVFNAGSYAVAAPLAVDVAGKALLSLPDGLGRAALEAWLQQLPDSNPPTWLGLPLSADKQLQTLSGKYILTQLARLQGHGSSGKGSGAADDTLSLQALSKRARLSLAAIPQIDSLLPPVLLADMEAKASDAALSPLQRFLAREVLRGVEAARAVSDDLSLAAAYFSGDAKITNNIRECVNSLERSRVPLRWLRLYTSDASGAADSPDSWVAELARRLRALASYSAPLSNAPAAAGVVYNVALMFSPEAFFTATRQQAAQRNEWSVEELELFLDIEGEQGSDSEGVLGLRLGGGGEWREGRLLLSDRLSCALPPSRLRWRPRADSSTAAAGCIALPLYSGEARQAVMSCLLPAGPLARSACEQRGLCLAIDYAWR